MDDLMIICREVDKQSGKVAVYPRKIQVDSRLLLVLDIRQQLNPEQRYYAAAREIWGAEKDNITRQLGRQPVVCRNIASGGPINDPD